MTCPWALYAPTTTERPAKGLVIQNAKTCGCSCWLKVSEGTAGFSLSIYKGPFGIFIFEPHPACNPYRNRSEANFGRMHLFFGDVLLSDLEE